MTRLTRQYAENPGVAVDPRFAMQQRFLSSNDRAKLEIYHLGLRTQPPNWSCDQLGQLTFNKSPNEIHSDSGGKSSNVRGSFGRLKISAGGDADDPWEPGFPIPDIKPRGAHHSFIRCCGRQTPGPTGRLPVGNVAWTCRKPPVFHG